MQKILIKKIVIKDSPAFKVACFEPSPFFNVTIAIFYPLLSIIFLLRFKHIYVYIITRHAPV